MDVRRTHPVGDVRARYAPSMTARRSLLDTLLWCAIAVAGGLVVAWADTSARDVQGPVLLLMLLNFALTLAGRAPVVPAAIASAVGLPLLYAFHLHAFVPGTLAAVIPALIGGGGGKLVGRFLDDASAHLVDAHPRTEAAWYERPLSLRSVLGSVLVALAAAGMWPVRAALLAIGHPVAGFVMLVWEMMTLVGWTALAPVILRERARTVNDEVTLGITVPAVTMHVAIVLALCTLHAAAITVATAMLLIPIRPGWPEMARAAFGAYLPLDAAAYLSILALGYVSDVERQRRAAAQREAALHAEAIESRLSALRARLNPHFLFNALNSVDVLARSGRADDTSHLLGGISSLLRYVLDERRDTVPLSEELDFVRRYLSVQQARFGDRLRADVHVGPEVESLAVPQLVLQPIVENAVEHGIARMLEGGMVRVTALRDEDSLRVIVENDGPAPGNQGLRGGVGLTTTRERLVRLFGDRASLSIEARSAPDSGTRVVLRLPIAEMAKSA